MGRRSQQKGKRGELEFNQQLNELMGTSARRGWAEGTDQIEGIPGVHMEIKRCERLRLYEFMQQAVRDTEQNGDLPVLAHRQNNQDWVVIVRLKDLPEFIRRGAKQLGIVGLELEPLNLELEPLDLEIKPLDLGISDSL